MGLYGVNTWPDPLEVVHSQSPSRSKQFNLRGAQIIFESKSTVYDKIIDKIIVYLGKTLAVRQLNCAGRTPEWIRAFARVIPGRTMPSTTNKDRIAMGHAEVIESCRAIGNEYALKVAISLYSLQKLPWG